jgi:hypothetical protein
MQRVRGRERRRKKEKGWKGKKEKEEERKRKREKKRESISEIRGGDRGVGRARVVVGRYAARHAA